jgi:poly-gamma-glutamate synthesis protein (capsule biosynthesis protein)
VERDVLQRLGVGILAITLSACSSATGSVSSTTFAPPALAPAPRSLTVVGTGDVLIHNTLWTQAEADGGGRGMDFSRQLAGVRKRVRSADFAICHLETTLAPEGGPYGSYPVFATPPAIVNAIKKTGYDACSTVSNHTLDQGFAGVKRTLDGLDAAGIGHSGTARSKAESARIAAYTVKGVTVAHLAYTYGFNGYARPTGRTWCCNVIDADRIIGDARSARDQGADIVILSLHAGDENVAAPNAQQQNVVAAIAESGQVDLVLGAHVHVVQPVAKVGQTWVAYGMGNLVSGQYDTWKRNKEGALVSFTFTEDPQGQFTVTRAAGYPVLNTSDPVRVTDLATNADAGAAGTREHEAYQTTRRTLLSLGAAQDGFIVERVRSRR